MRRTSEMTPASVAPAFKARGIQGGLIGDRGVFGAALVSQPSVLRADGGIVETRRNRMSRRDLPVFILQDVSVRSLQNSGPRPGKSLVRRQASSVFAQFT